MAAALEFNLICKEFIDIERVLESSVIRKLEIEIEKIFSIDNWLWLNQQELQDIALISQSLEKTKIVVIDLKCDVFKDAGVYIEKIDEEYVYNL